MMIFKNDMEEKIFEEKEKLVKGIDAIQNEYLKEMKNIDNEWLNFIFKEYNGKTYTLKEVIKIAKNVKLKICDELKICDLDTQKKLNEKLTKINEGIEELEKLYNEKYNEKEAKKDRLFDDKKIEKGLLIKESIKRIIETINLRLEELKKEHRELLDKLISEEYDSAKFDEKSGSIVYEINDLINTNKSMNILLTYNGNYMYYSEEFEDELVKACSLCETEIIKAYYKLICYNVIDMKNLEKKAERKKKKIDKPHKEIDESNKKLIEDVTALVEEVEKTGKSKDFKNAYDAIKLLPDCDEKNELSSRLKTVSEKNESRYFELQDIILKDINDEKGIDKDTLEELDDRYRYLSKEKCEEVKDNYSKIIEYYNNAVQDEYQQSLEKEDFKKHSLSDKIREFMGAVVNFTAGTKIAKKVKNKRLKKLKEKLDNEENDKKITRIENKISNIKDSILDNDIVTGVRLFKARNKLANQKFKLYHDNSSKGFITTEDGEEIYKTKTTDLIGKKLSKGLSKITSDEKLKNDKERVINVLDQYLELVASGTFEEDYVNQAFDYLGEVKDILSESEYNGYLNELLMISNYRCDNAGIPYHINNDETYEVDNVINFYDSEGYNNAFNKPRYMKRK